MQNQSPIKLYYVSAPAGSGKTHGLTRHAATLAASDNRKVIIAQPTTELIRQTAADLRALKPELAVTTIYKVKPNEANTFLVQPVSYPKAVVITGQALSRLFLSLQGFFKFSDYCQPKPASQAEATPRVAIEAARPFNFADHFEKLEETTDRAIKAAFELKKQARALRKQMEGR